MKTYCPEVQKSEFDAALLRAQTVQPAPSAWVPHGNPAWIVDEQPRPVWRKSQMSH